MTNQPGRPAPDEPRKRGIDAIIARRAGRRRTRLTADIARTRKDASGIPTWVMAVLVGLFFAGWAYLLITR
jgi:hypothetical protein